MRSNALFSAALAATLCLGTVHCGDAHAQRHDADNLKTTQLDDIAKNDPSVRPTTPVDPAADSTDGTDGTDVARDVADRVEDGIKDTGETIADAGRAAADKADEAAEDGAATVEDAVKAINDRADPVQVANADEADANLATTPTHAASPLYCFAADRTPHCGANLQLTAAQRTKYGCDTAKPQRGCFQSCRAFAHGIDPVSSAVYLPYCRDVVFERAGHYGRTLVDTIAWLNPMHGRR